MKKVLKVILVIGLFVLFLKLNNQYIVSTHYTLQSEKIPSNFDGFKIVQVSDLHDGLFGEDNSRLIKKVQKEQPDVIFITGDVIDSRRYDLQQSLGVVEQLVDLAPTYFVTGNHEVAVNEVAKIYRELEDLGVHTLKNETIPLTKGDEEIYIAGIEDPLAGYSIEKLLPQVLENTKEHYTLLLSHRPELFQFYVWENVDAVFAGHAHGGQFRIPFLLDGTYAPGQGWLPQYTAGTYEENETTMIVSRGLGNSVIQQRLFNLPEIITVTLHTE